MGRVLSRPTLLPLPAFAARIAFGEMADGLLLASARVEPAKLIEAGFRFRHDELENALRSAL
jgi:NAD dependent epimerase/dehydratase family enzyme